jgi:DNA-binding PucR family transcriptional regulator
VSTTELQRVLDTLAATMQREVAIDDLDLRLIAYTSHVGKVDEVRRQAILTRQAPAQARAWVMKHGLAKAKKSVRVKANEDIEMLARVCIPLRAHGLHYGYLWLIDPDESLTAAQVAQAEAAAEQCADLLHRERMTQDLADARDRELLRDLLSDQPDIRDLAITEVESAGLFDTAGPATVMCLGTTDGRARLDEVLGDLAATVPRRTCWRLVRPDHAVLVVSRATMRARPRLAQDLAAAGVLVGVGSPAKQLHDVSVAYREARQALRLASLLPHLRPIASWPELGVYALLAELPLERLDRSAVHPGIRALRDQDPVLAETLELFLDRAGDTRTVAEQLAVHRATVYHRIERVQAITGLDLEDGETRLVAHLSLKLLRLL